ncbi:MAG: hypothetical protein A2Z25_02960 [Planctomycetes bacterium RBG_16_55_9]|nr:MAG: hypothetical protein A2Z25_02960 [Planctomycetes bacterium RBG_16_55_9]
MAIEAPTSKFKKTNLMIYIALCVGLAAWFTYDGYFNEKFEKKYTNDNGQPNATLVINRKTPPFLIGAAALLGFYLFLIKDKKLVADDLELILGPQKKIPYDSIEKIDRTYFEKKGFFTVTYKDENGREVDLKMSDRKYDNLGPVLDHLVAKIS